MNNASRFALLVALAPTLSAFAAPSFAPVEKPVSLIALAGYAPLTGEGVVLTLNDRTLSSSKNSPGVMAGLVHDYDVLTIINHLRFAGAQGISVGGVRLTNQSSIVCVGPRLLVDKTPLSLPLRIEAVGNTALLKTRLQAKGGPLDFFKSNGPRIQMSGAGKLRLGAAPLPANLKTSETS